MGTLYDLLGALPSDDAEGLRTAFRKAAKATHPDLNPDNPDAAVRFRELVRAHDILTDAEQRATYDQLLTIALQPPVAKATRTYEVVGRFASNTVAASIISAVLVGGYVLFGMFSKPPSAAEAAVNATVGVARESAARYEARVQHPGDGSAGGAIVVASAAPPLPEPNAGVIGRFEPLAGFAAYNLAVQHYPRFATSYIDRGVFYRAGDFERPFVVVAPAKRITDSKRSKSATPAPLKPLSILAPLPERRKPVTAALTP
jgi:curved DNA-binding protein CbpA